MLTASLMPLQNEEAWEGRKPSREEGWALVGKRGEG